MNANQKRAALEAMFHGRVTAESRKLAGTTLAIQEVTDQKVGPAVPASEAGNHYGSTGQNKQRMMNESPERIPDDVFDLTKRMQSKIAPNEYSQMASQAGVVVDEFNKQQIPVDAIAKLVNGKKPNQIRKEMNEGRVQEPAYTTFNDQILAGNVFEEPAPTPALIKEEVKKIITESVNEVRAEIKSALKEEIFDIIMTEAFGEDRLNKLFEAKIGKVLKSYLEKAKSQKK